MSKKSLLCLDENDLSQVVAGLWAREQAWRKTAEYLRSGYYNPDDSFVAEDCSDEDEADKIACFYARIISMIEQKYERQADFERNCYLQGKADGLDNLIQRLLVNWERLQSMGLADLHQCLLEIRDEICDTIWGST